MRVLVTGGTGLIGKHAVAALVEQGHDIFVLTRSMTSESSGAHVVQGDVLDVQGMGEILKKMRPTHLLHLAWVTEHGQFWNSQDNETWLSASKALISNFQHFGGQRVVVAGSCAEYDWTKLDDGICREGQTPLNPHTLYGQAKVALFQWLSQSMSDFAWGRVFFPYGVGEDLNRLVPSVTLALLLQQEAKCTSGKQIRDFMHAEDAGRAFAALLMSAVTGAVNVASGEPHAVAEVAKTLGTISGHPELVRLGALEDRSDDPPKLVADITRLRNEVGYISALSLDDGLSEVFDHFKAHPPGQTDSSGKRD